MYKKSESVLLFTAWLRRISQAQMCPFDVCLKESDPVHFCCLDFCFHSVNTIYSLRKYTERPDFTTVWWHVRSGNKSEILCNIIWGTPWEVSRCTTCQYTNPWARLPSWFSRSGNRLSLHSTYIVQQVWLRKHSKHHGVSLCTSTDCAAAAAADADEMYWTVSLAKIADTPTV